MDWGFPVGHRALFVCAQFFAKEHMDVSESSGSATTGPATFAEAFAADASSASTSSQTPTSTDTPSASTTDSPELSTTDGTTPASGEPPKERWADILDNARTKAREETEAQWQQHAWAKQVSPQEYQQVADMARKASTDPIAYLQDFIKDLQTHPTYGAQLKSLAAKALSQRSQQAPQEPQLETFPVDLGDGRIVQLATADSIQKRESWLQQQWLSQAEQKFQPYTQTLESLKAEHAAVAKQREVTQYVETTRADVLTWPGMDDKANQALLGSELAKVQLDENTDSREILIALNNLHRKHIQPKLASKSESSLLENLQRKAAASTSINPGSAASTSPRPVNSFKDLPAEAWR